MRKTKIVCTIGPNEEDYGLLLKLAENMDVARFNFSHGTHESHKRMLGFVRKAAKELGRPIAAMLDTKGPEIRTGLLENHAEVELEAGKAFVVTTEECTGSAERVSVSYELLQEDVKRGDTLLIDDGLIELEVEEIRGKDICCRVVSGGKLGEKKGVNVPNVPIGLPNLTDKDREDIAFGIENDFDYIAASFTRNAAAVREIRELLERGGSKMGVIAKIESQEGIDNIEEIIEEADGVMVARGDLGVEVDAKRIPQLQKDIIDKCNFAGKLVITATQMLDSMIRNPRPTRAEVTDVANAVYNGTDAVMLSGETANGKYPLEALEMMASVAEYTEGFLENNLFKNRQLEKGLYDSVANTTCRAAVTAAHELKARLIIAPTSSGTTARLLSKYRPEVDVAALSPDRSTVRKMMLYWGVRPILSERARDTDELFSDSIEKIKEAGLAEEGELCVITAGVISGRSKKSASNIMRIIEI